MRILFTGGGTAGHIYPQLALSDILQKNFGEVRCAFVGRRGGLEAEIFRKEKKECYFIEAEGFKRSLSLKNLSAVYKAAKGLFEAKKIICDFRPDIIIGTGGYVCFPLLRAGQKMGIKTVLHESNAYPGLTVRLLSRKCDAVLLNYEKAKERLGKKTNCITVGNPIRGEFLALTRKEARKRLGIKDNEIFILSFGGSIGAEAINNASLGVMSEYSLKNKRVKHIHATGKRFYEDSLKIYKDIKGRCGCDIMPYIEDIPLYMSAADITITRSGAITLTELAYCAPASILVPSPNVTANHQYENAKCISDTGGAILMEEKDLSTEGLIKAVSELCENDKKRKEMSRSIRAFYRSDCNETIAKIIAKIINSASH